MALTMMPKLIGGLFDLFENYKFGDENDDGGGAKVNWGLSSVAWESSDLLLPSLQTLRTCFEWTLVSYN